MDIPGHMAGVQIESPLHVHTCKHGIWNQDGRFDVAALADGVIRMPHYELCLQAENTSIGARLLLAECSEAELQTWTLRDSGEIALEAFPQMCITVEGRPGRNAHLLSWTTNIARYERPGLRRAISIGSRGSDLSADGS